MLDIVSLPAIAASLAWRWGGVGVSIGSKSGSSCFMAIRRGCQGNWRRLRPGRHLEMIQVNDKFEETQGGVFF